MARNYHKDGYSCAEVAQILHVIPQTIRNWIDSGKLQANMSHGEVTPGRRRTIRITRRHLSDFLKKNFMKYDNAEYAPFIIQDNTGDENPKLPCPTSDKQSDFGESDIPNPAYVAHSLSELSGAWAHLQPEEEVQEETTMKTQEPTFMISINGRVAIGNLARETCSIIFGALTSDSHFEFDEITIKAMKGVSK